MQNFTNPSPRGKKLLEQVSDAICLSRRQIPARWVKQSAVRVRLSVSTIR